MLYRNKYSDKEQWPAINRAVASTTEESGKSTIQDIRHTIICVTGKEIDVGNAILGKSL